MAAPTRRSQIPSMAELCGLGDELISAFNHIKFCKRPAEPLFIGIEL
jgi:hypothetical protein